MQLFLTSSPTGPFDGSRTTDGLDEMNHFVDNLRSVWKANSNVLLIAAYPYRYDGNDEMCDYFRNVFLNKGFTMSHFDLCDARYVFSKKEIEAYDVLILAGGHVIEQHAFFKDIHLKECLQDYNGIVIGISAGSMNSARIVYNQVEEPGEGLDPDFPRFLDGLGLTERQIVPHLQMIDHGWVDGRRTLHDWILDDTYNHCYYGLLDGSYIWSDNGKETLWGESYLLKDGQIIPYSKENEVIQL
ncbi:MAG: Type 1 glutamine amidotransferase-like domain-containing protein [Holdemanella sp.]|nr:Type 1 glutamine amidotransferase-like domain-containing protein [Holdemanella sp.]